MGKAFFIAVPIAIAMVVVIGIAVFGGGGEEAATPPSPPSRPASTTSASPTSSSSRSPSAETSTAASATYTTPTMDVSTDRPKRPGPYGNIATLTDSKLYGVKLGAWKCPALANPVAPEGNKEFRSWADGLIDCMMSRFGSAVSKAAGQKMVRPKLVYFSGTVETPCGKITDHVPVYCGTSESNAIYLNPAKVRKYDDYVRLGAVQIMFHEFAHHVQFQFGLLHAGYQADVEDRMQISRRVELQAECISWSQTTQLTQPKFGASDAEQMWHWVSQDQDAKHGKSTSYQYWYKRIAGKGDLSRCNTWVAAKKHVR